MPENENNSSTMGRVYDVGKYMVPFLGTYYSFKDAYNNPTFGNILNVGLGALTDAISLTGAGAIAKSIVGARAAGRALKGAQSAYDASKAAIAASRVNSANAVRDAQRARNASESVTLLGGGDRGMSRIVQYEKRVQAAEEAARQAAANERAAMNATNNLERNLEIAKQNYRGVQDDAFVNSIGWPAVIGASNVTRALVPEKRK